MGEYYSPKKEGGAVWLNICTENDDEDIEAGRCRMFNAFCGTFGIASCRVEKPKRTTFCVRWVI
jgi:hypothetical protein